MSPPRRRKPEYADLAPNLWWNGSVYVYRRPDGSQVSLGSRREAAVRAAIRANRLLAPASEALHDRIMGTSSATVAELLERYRAEFWPTRDLSASTLTQYRSIHGAIERAFGRLTPAQLTRRLVAEFVDRATPRGALARKSQLSLFFRWCMAKGEMTEDFAGGLITSKIEVERRRLTLEDFWQIHAAAPAWLQHAMMLALQSLQPRQVLVALKFEHYRDGKLAVRREKTGAHIMIEAGPELDAAIRACRDDIASPFMVHRQPRVITAAARAREHWTQVGVSALSEAFAAAREAAGLYTALPSRQRPSLHELRALGAKLYERAGVDPQALLGHKDAETTRIYLDRHEVEWIEATAGLEI